MKQITPTELAAWLGQAEAPTRKPPPQMVDVREPWEYQLCHLPASMPVPLGSLPARLAELDAQRPTVLLCHHGARSMQAALFLEHNGFADVYNLRGGIDAWSRDVDPALPRY